MQAFDSLVVDDDTKELVKALVTNQLAGEKATDLMTGKGNGLVILLHGFARKYFHSLKLKLTRDTVVLEPVRRLLQVSEITISLAFFVFSLHYN